MSEYFSDKEPGELKFRAQMATVAVSVIFFVLTARLWQLQVFSGDYYSGLAENNRIRTVKSPAPRGMIYDRLGVKIAENRPGFDLYLVPEDVQDWDKTKAALKNLSGITAETVDDKLDRAEGRPQFQAVKLKEDLTWEDTVKIESAKFELPGIILEVSPKRSYVYGEAVAHLIGYLGEISEKELKETRAGAYGPGDLTGKYGLEKAFEKDLRGVDGGKELEVDALGRKIKVVKWSPPYPGNDMKLTIDIRTQMAAWAALRGHAGAAVAMEPSTGKVIAMVSTPSFDPNSLSTGLAAADWQEFLDNPQNILMNRALQGQYPPASTFKPIHAAAALEEEVITPSTRIYSGPSFRFAGRDYRDWKEEGHGNISVHRAIVESSDTFFYQTGLKMGVDKLAEYSRKFGFGSKTGIELLNEKSGIVPSSEWKKKVFKTRWFDGETISVSVGQGYMLTTPMQLLSAYAAIANGGTLYSPHIVDEISTPMGMVVKSFYPEKRGDLPVSALNIRHVKEALRGVTEEEGGTASFLRLSGLKIAGKTGTAQVSRLLKRARNVESTAYDLRDHAWFAGYAPYDDPKIAVVVIVEHGGFGASAAAPVAREIFRAYIAGDKYMEKEGAHGDTNGLTAMPAPAPVRAGREGEAND